MLMIEQIFKHPWSTVLWKEFESKQLYGKNTFVCLVTGLRNSGKIGSAFAPHRGTTP